MAVNGFLERIQRIEPGAWRGSPQHPFLGLLTVLCTGRGWRYGGGMGAGNWRRGRFASPQRSLGLCDEECPGATRSMSDHMARANSPRQR